MTDVLYPRDIEKEAKRLADRIMQIKGYHDREGEIQRVPYDLRGRVEHYLQLLYYQRNKNDYL